MERKLVNIGDGRIIEFKEEEAPKSLPSKPSKPPNKNTNGNRKKSTAPRPGRCKRTSWARGARWQFEQIPGYRDWYALRNNQIRQFFNKPGGPVSNRKGIPDGMRRPEAEAAWVIARQKARQDMDNLKKAGVTFDDERAEEAMLSTLEVLRSPLNQDIKLKAARQVLEWTKAKPASSQNVTVNAAEAWLAQIAEDVSE